MCVPNNDDATDSSSPKLPGATITTDSTISQRLSRFTATHPLSVLLSSLTFATIISFIGIYVGEFKIEVDNKGWLSRGTAIADRQMQIDVLKMNRRDLFNDSNGTLWERLVNEEAVGFTDVEEKNALYQDRRRSLMSTAIDLKNDVLSSLSSKDISTTRDRTLLTSDMCDAWYNNPYDVLWQENLFALWKVQPELDDFSPDVTQSILDKEVINKICTAEQNSLRELEDAGLCTKCDTGVSKSNTCLPPHSLIYLIRNRLDSMDSSCEELTTAYSAIQEEFVDEMITCTNTYIDNFDKASLVPGDMSNCTLRGYLPSLVDINFGQYGNRKLRFSSSYFRTYDVNPFGEDELAKKELLYEISPDFDNTGNANEDDVNIVIGYYDTVYEAIKVVKTDLLIQGDMALAIASLGITFIAMMIHTRSPWLTLLGILQIIYGIPMSYFVYVFIARLDFFPFLNFIGVFVAAALGADDLFVAVDKWKNARIANPSGSTADVAAVALPDSAKAMLLTTSTTAVAFFATCICPVPPILCFAVYCGLMIIFNYIMNVLLVFPGLCMYDIWLQNGSRFCCVTLCATRKEKGELSSEDGDDDLDNAKADVDPEQHEAAQPENMSLIHRALHAYYNFIHKFRWLVFASSIGATVLCIYLASNLRQPENTEVRLLPASDPLEKHFMWQNFMQSTVLFRSGQGVDYVFGLKAGDTGPQNKPDILTKLLLDETFDPSSKVAQEHLRDFCPKLFKNDFASPPYTGYECPINAFDSWLGEQSNFIATEQADAYKNNCAESSKLPVAENVFDPCIIAWSKLVDNTDVLAQNGKVRILLVGSKASIDFRQPIPRIRAEWDSYEDFLKADREIAPAGLQNHFHVSQLWWWMDTNVQMFRTAIGAAGIAIAFSAVIVLISSRSLMLMLFSEICIIYVLAAATAMLVGIGWELGFLESVCFAILVGISCDFVIHFGHAYIHHEGAVAKEVRTKYAVIHMGPSILAAAVTTFSAATVMLFCQVIFFTKFAMILLVTIFQATLGSFVIFIVLNDLFGPSEPTKLIDSCVTKISGKGADKTHADANDLALSPENVDENIDNENQ